MKNGKKVSSNLTSLVILGIGAMLCFLFCVSILANAYKYKFTHDDVVYVTGNAQVDFEADIVKWTGLYSRTSPDLKTASQQLDNDKKVVESFLLKQGIDKEAIKFAAVGINRDYEKYYDKHDNYITKFIGYTLTQRVTVESSDLEKIDNVSREVSSLILDGIIFTSELPQYYYSGLEDLKLQIIAKASENAYQRATNIATESKTKLKGLIKSDMGVFQITGKNENEAFRYGGTFNTESRYKTANITVKNSYSLK